MPIADIVIAVAVAISVIVGFARGFVKEAMSVASLLIAIWAAFNFGSHAAALSESFLSSSGMQIWFGRILVFVVVLSLGGLLGWGIAKLVRLSVLSGMDRVFGTVFGFARGVGCRFHHRRPVREFRPGQLVAGLALHSTHRCRRRLAADHGTQGCGNAAA